MVYIVTDSDNSSSTTQQKGLSTMPNYSAFDNKQSDTKEKDQISNVIKEDKPQGQNIETAPKQNQKQESTEKAAKAPNIYPSLKGGTYEGYPELNISKNFYTNGLDHYYRAFDRILPADNSGKLIASWGTEESYTPKITELGENLKAGKPMPRLSAIDLGNATDKEREFHTTLTEIYKANSEAIENDKKRKAQAKEQAIAKSTATQNSQTPNSDTPLTAKESASYISQTSTTAKKEEKENRAALAKIEQMRNNVSNPNSFSNSLQTKKSNIAEKEPAPSESANSTRVNASWGELQPELTADAHKFTAVGHEFTAKELSDTLNNKNATKNIERLSKMSREEIEKRYKTTNKYALSDLDNIEQRVNDAFLKGEGLEDITINDKIYKGLLFDENSGQSQKLRENETFQTYYESYLFYMKEIISQQAGGKEIDTKAISEMLKTKLGKPNFSVKSEIPKYDYYGLMGGTQNIEVDFEVIPISKGEYNLETTMYINDWYGADADDINNHVDYKNGIKNVVNLYLKTYPIGHTIISTLYNNSDFNLKKFIPGLDDFFWLQHHYNRKPFPTQIIYKSEDKIKLDN